MKHEVARELKASITNSYILPCDDGYLVIDTSYEKDYKKYLKALNALGIDLPDIRYILLTHHHGDHSGLVAQIINQSDVRIIVHEKGLGFLKKGENEFGEPPNLRVKSLIPLFKLIGGLSDFPPVVIRDEDLVVTGDDDALLRGIGIEGKILHTPGHTSDSISVILDDGNAYVGDLSMNLLKIVGFKYRPMFIVSKDKLFANWRRVLDAGSKTIHPAHGKPFPAERLAETGWI